ncbi:LamG domain-containing protein [Alteromonas sp. ASW11-36]|uniref:LamG domain-containing protein n=1 Tax=Alteromonas arenosi TaxID=3055817 RepID=A0ABT7SSF6_9ALTE|nr:LamG domain-containing protein [Alteromonas sp. ASW11-36]MDM7859134.1 LamG domain-containing protein [Alteromonas sp. ASW11-36]
MKRLGAVLLAMWSSCVIAVECVDVFPDPASSFAANGELEMKLNARIYGSDGILSFNEINDQTGGNNSCDTQPCVAGPTNSANLQLSPFRFSRSNQDVKVRRNTTASLAAGSYDDVTIEAGAQLTLNSTNGTYIIDDLSAKQNTVLYLNGGDYWIKELKLAQGVRLIVTGSEAATIYVQEAIFQLNSQINFNNEPSKLSLISYDEVKLNQGVLLNGFVYAASEVELQLNAQITGAVNTTELKLAQGSSITYAPDDLTTADFGTACISSAPAPDPISHWPIDVCSLSGTIDEILDIEGGNHGQALNGAGVDYDGQYCQAGSFSGSGDVISIPHTDDYHIASGTVSFWFKVPDLSFSNRSSAGGMGIFSKDSTSFDDGGHLTMWVTSSGAIRVRMQSTAASATLQTTNLINEDQWHHVAFTFGTSGIQLYIDGVLQGSNNGFTSGLGNNREPIILGGNAWQTSDNASPANELKDLFKGSIDDLKLFDQQLSSAQITNLFNEIAGTCQTCQSDAELTAHWPLDLCSVNGSSGEIVDIVGNSPGNTVGNAGTLNDGKFCQAGRLDGTGAHINIPHTSAMELSAGSLSLWIKVSDLDYSNSSDVGGMGILSRDSTNFDNGGHLTIWLESDGSVNARHQSTSASYNLDSNAGLIAENTWHHIVYSFGNQRMRLFVDGVQVATNASYGGGINGNSEPLILGATAVRSGDGESTPSQLRDFFKGDLDDVRLYRNELSQADVVELYEASSYVCTNCTGDLPVAFYQFEQEEYAAPGDVLDSSANAFDADPIGNVAPILPDVPISCRALDVPRNLTVDAIDAINTKLDINEIGGRGTISFWYRSTNPWFRGGARQLFDASQLADPPNRNNSQDKYFFLVLRNNGSLRFAMEDNLDRDFRADTGRINIPANQWVHIAVAWDLVNDTAQIYVNGQAQSVRISSSLRTSQIAGVGDLYFGDIGNTYVIAGGTDNSAYGQYDDVRVYNFTQSRAQILADMAAVTECATIDHYQIVHSEQALTCDAADVTIRACANEECSKLADVPSTVTLSPSGWAGGDIVTFTGSTALSLSQSTAGTTTIGITAAVPGADVQCNPDCSIEFVDAGFEFFNVNQPASSVLDPVIAESDLGGIGIRAVQNQNGVCGPLLQGSQTVSLEYECVSTADAPYSTNQCAVPFAGVAVNGDGSGSNAGNLQLQFDSNGETTLTGYQYADAGRLAVAISAVVQGINISSGATVVDSVPAALSVTSDVADPHTAGESFNLNISALGANGTALPSYSPGQLQMSLQRLSPALSNVDGALSLAADLELNSSSVSSYRDISGLSFSNGQYNYAQAYFEEVGTLSVAVRDQAYLGQTITSQNITLGRFIPAYFAVQTRNQGTLADACSASFTYIGQAFDFILGQEPSISITAYNALGNVTSNYAGDLWELAPNTADISFADSSGYSGSAAVNQIGNLAIRGSENYDGVTELDLLNSEFEYIKDSQPTAPFESSLNLTFSADFFTDADGVCYQSNYPDGCEAFSVANIRGTEQRYGRLVVGNTYGPETETLPVPLIAEYFTADGWRTNTQDSCTSIALSQSTGDIQVSNASVGDFESDITSLLNSMSASGTLVDGLSDRTDMQVGPPLDNNGEGVRGTISITLDPTSGAVWSDYLNVDWNQDGVIDNNDAPTGIVSFGVYRGNDRTIHWREVF